MRIDQQRRRDRRRARRSRRSSPWRGRAAGAARKCRAYRRSTSCAAPSSAMPRTSVRVVCTLCVTIATLVPTSALMQRRLAGIGRADQRDEAAARRSPGAAAAGSSAIAAVRPHALALEHGGGRRLLGGALGAAEPFGRLAVRAARRRRGTPGRDAARCARPRDRPASAGRAPAPIPAAWSWDRAADAPARASARPTAARPAPAAAA